MGALPELPSADPALEHKNFLDCLDAFEHLLNESDAAAAQQWQTLRQEAGRLDPALARKIESAVRNFDFHSALDNLRGLRDLL